MSIKCSSDQMHNVRRKTYFSDSVHFPLWAFQDHDLHDNNNYGFLLFTLNQWKLQNVHWKSILCEITQILKHIKIHLFLLPFFHKPFKISFYIENKPPQSLNFKRIVPGLLLVCNSSP